MPPPSSESANTPLVVTLLAKLAPSLIHSVVALLLAIPCVEDLFMMSGGAGGVWIRPFNAGIILISCS